MSFCSVFVFVDTGCRSRNGSRVDLDHAFLPVQKYQSPSFQLFVSICVVGGNVVWAIFTLNIEILDPHMAPDSVCEVAQSTARSNAQFVAERFPKGFRRENESAVEYHEACSRFGFER